MLAVHKVNNVFGLWSQLMPTTLFISPRQEEKQEQQELFKGGMHACCHTKHWSEEVACHSVTHANILFFINAWWNNNANKKVPLLCSSEGVRSHHHQTQPEFEGIRTQHLFLNQTTVQTELHLCITKQNKGSIHQGVREEEYKYRWEMKSNQLEPKWGCCSTSPKC